MGILGFHALFLTIDRILGISQILVALFNILNVAFPVMFLGVKRMAPRTSHALSVPFVFASQVVALRFFVLTYSLLGQDANCLALCSCFQMSEELSDLHRHDFYAFDGEILDMARTKNQQKPQKKPTSVGTRDLVVCEDP